jgi:hypothetical protein
MFRRASTRRWVFAGAGIAGLVLFALLLPLFDAPMPRGLSATRADARRVADAAAKELGIDVANSWSIITWEPAIILERVYEDKPDLRRKADADPVIGPRLNVYRVTYFHKRFEKNPPMGFILVGKDGKVVGARRMARPEESGASPVKEQLQAQAEAFVRSRSFPGAPNPQFEEVRPTVQRARTDHIFRYKVKTTFPSDDVVFYLNVYYIGSRPAGWVLIEEYADGRQFRFGFGENLIGTFAGFAVLFVLLLILLVLFLKKYHAGEVGVETGGMLFALSLAIALVYDYCIGAETSLNTGFGDITAQLTALAATSFGFLFADIPIAVVVFLAWSVGESYARERWGERLASFDSILRRDPINATVGSSILCGIFAAPVIAGLSLAVAAIPLILGTAHPVLSGGVGVLILGSTGGVGSVLLFAAKMAIAVAVVGLLFILAAFNRRRLLPIGIVVATLIIVVAGNVEPPIAPLGQQLLFGFGGALAAVAVFLAADLLSAAIAIFFATLLLCFVPFIRVVDLDVARGSMWALAIPLVAAAIVAVAGMLTRRQVEYTYEDLAPHVKRIVERERVKAEIDAANRIQAALLPSEEPDLNGASVASHYRAATEIGGDYFDFLELEDGTMAVAFGDVAGHGLTSGIVMAMAKSALLVQIGYDPSPARVLEVLNDIVRKTAPKRMLMTFFFGILDSDKMELRFSSAGHLDPYVYRAKSRHLEPLSAWGFPLGVRRQEPFREHLASFDPGDRLILYSDGLIEAVDDDGEPFGFDRFEKVLVDNGSASADEIKKALLHSVKKFTRNRPPEDDQTLVVISFEGSERVARTA